MTAPHFSSIFTPTITTVKSTVNLHQLSRTILFKLRLLLPKSSIYVIYDDLIPKETPVLVIEKSEKYYFEGLKCLYFRDTTLIGAIRKQTDQACSGYVFREDMLTKWNLTDLESEFFSFAVDQCPLILRSFGYTLISEGRTRSNEIPPFKEGDRVLLLTDKNVGYHIGIVRQVNTENRDAMIDHKSGRNNRPIIEPWSAIKHPLYYGEVASRYQLYR